jgi:predicted acetyltransferase
VTSVGTARRRGRCYRPPVPVEIRHVRDDELVDYVDSLSAGFLERPDVAKVAEEVRPLWELDRTWAAVDGDRFCGTFRSWDTELTVPGLARLPASAVSAVTVSPTHRRRGILRRMIAAEHAAMRERGESIGLLYASEYPIYGRFGYGPAVRDATWTIDTRSATFHAEIRGAIEIVRPDPASRDAIAAVFETWRQRQPGEIRRRPYRWDFELALRESSWDTPWKGFLALHRDEAGAVDGFARYRVEGKWDQGQPRNILNVDELHALADDAYNALWRFLSEIDWIASIKAERRSPSERLPWLLTNARAAQLTSVNDGMWVRLFDLPRALEARTWERPASLVIEAIDDEAEGGRVRVALDAGPDGAACRPTDCAPDLTLHVAALGAAYLGGTPLRHAVSVRGVDEHRAGALAEADAAFRTLDPPWTSTFF